MLPSKMIGAIGQLFERSQIRYSQNVVEEDFLHELFRADGKKAGNPEFDPSLHDFCAENSFWLGCHDRSGDLIATVAARRIESSTFLDSCRSYRLWYGDKIHLTESLDVVFDQYDRLPTGIVSFLGAAWVRPDWRGRGLSWALTRLCYFVAIERWPLDWLIAMVFSGIAQAKMPAGNYGFPRSDLFANDYRLLGFSRQKLYLLTMKRQEAMALAAKDHQFLTERPYLTLDSGFGNELRAQRHHAPDVGTAETALPLKIAS